MVIDTHRIKQRLFDSAALDKILAAYGMDTKVRKPANPDEMANWLFEAMGQQPQDPDRPVSNREVFRAAARAIGSNSRKWACFLGHEPQLKDLLHGYDPVATWEAAASGQLIVDLADCLPGQTCNKDAQALLDWARLLAETKEYYTRIVRRVADIMRQNARHECSEWPEKAVLMMCVVGVLADPSKRWIEAHLPDRAEREVLGPKLKLPGMRYALGSEFLRNLGWSGFKPDRHVRRLFRRWFPRPWPKIDPQAKLLRLIGREGSELSDHIGYSLMGVRATPDGEEYSQVDNLVWLLAVYIEKKGHESDTDYLA